MYLKCVNMMTISHVCKFNQLTEASNYRKHIALHKYNLAVAFTSMGAEINTLPGCGTCYF
jgi:hypothetical protein